MRPNLGKSYALTFAALAVAVMFLSASSSSRANPSCRVPCLRRLLIAFSIFAMFVSAKAEPRTNGQSVSTIPIVDQVALSNFAATIEVRQKEREAAMDRSLDEWRTPIEFYGKVVDENNSPVQGVQIDFACNDLSTEGTSYYHTASDSGGMFSITGIRGKLLSAKLSKTGYYVSKRDNDSFTYAGENVNFKPDATNPILFHLRKHGQGEPLTTASSRLKVPLSGVPVNWSVLNGKQEISSERIVLICQSQAQLKQAGSREYDWSLKVTMPDGGLIETNEEFPFLAPESGYQPEILISMGAEKKELWQSMIQRSFFFRLRDGRYGRFNLSFISNNGVLRIDSCLNPSGSRNLEYDEAVQPKPRVFQ